METDHTPLFTVSLHVRQSRGQIPQMETSFYAATTESILLTCFQDEVSSSQTFHVQRNKSFKNKMSPVQGLTQSRTKQ